MKQYIAKVIVRLIGSVTGLFGICLACVSLFTIFNSIVDRSPWSSLLGFLTLPLAVYFISVAYLVWIRLSPIIVRQVCAILGFFCFSSILRLGTLHDTHVFWVISLYILFLIAVYFGYSILITYLNRLLFKEAKTK